MVRAAAPPELRASDADIARLAAFEHPTFFASLVRRNFIAYDLHWRIGDALRRVATGETTRLMINMPPRHGKSTLASLVFPAWYLGRWPDKRVIATSYSADLIRGFGRGARNVVGLPEYQHIFPGTVVDRASSAADRWDLAGRFGGYLGTSVGGAITGYGADVLLIDDPTKGEEAAESDKVRQNVIDWYFNDAYTRLEPGGAIIVIQTRWHEDDLSGHLLAQAADDPETDQWEVLSLPALDCAQCGAYPHLASCDGVTFALWPERWPVASMVKRRTVIGARGFEALFQQRPTLPEGNIFRRSWMDWRYTRKWLAQQQERAAAGLLERWWMIQTIDTATREGIGADYSTISTWATDGIRYFLIDVWRDRVDYPDLKKAVSEQYFKWRPRLVAVEDTTHGRPLYQEMHKDQGGIPMVAVPADGSKVTRAESVTGWFEAGNVVLPDEAEWLPEWLSEHLSFPNAAHDDQVDCTALALRLMTQRYEVQKGGKVKWTK